MLWFSFRRLCHAFEKSRYFYESNEEVANLKDFDESSIQLVKCRGTVFIKIITRRIKPGLWELRTLQRGTAVLER